MPYTVKEDCIACDSCRPECPNGAIKAASEGEGYWIDPTLCDRCPDVEIPRCVEACSVGSLTPLKPKKGRSKSTLLPAAIHEIFLNGKTNPFASCMVVWEACNVLAQRQSLRWQADDDHKLCYQRSTHRGRGEIRFRLATDPEMPSSPPMDYNLGMAALARFDIRAVCTHLIFAAHATTVSTPWEDTFVINDQHIEQYLGLNRRKDLTKLEKLTLIKDLVYQACHLLVSLDWPRQGKVQGFSMAEQPVWHLLDTQYYFETDAAGLRHLIGLGFTIRAGAWAKHFLNQQDYRKQTAFYQYGTLPQSLLAEVMGNWQQHEGAVRLLLWLVFKLRLGGDHRVTVRTLLRIAYGEQRLTEAMTVRGAHKRLLKTFESDLEAIYHYGLKPQFDPETYGPDIQPLWARVADIPDDADEALDFWADDANQALSLTSTAPRDKWQRLLNARLLGFELSDEWQQSLRKPKKRRSRHQSKAKTTPTAKPLSTQAIKTARQRLDLSQRDLAKRLGKSQSWIRDVEKGRFSVGTDDQTLLRQTLGI
ncbi:helix-turn-helix domain-containing protein [Nodosilinea sp. P-1105]|uniref:helix-turn-helix domain-containing protein n=1 Tax=Nodosilinea sp. P-1105 TaxID=2546229 RepID=UPI00146D4640|nr:helix-turn-helix domain-containing protein [Nodosilinea sp. P-1105]NMF83691.1 helix-turn-helix domain-containing protein [Nodosilinea sp. P-1105]